MLYIIVNPASKSGLGKTRFTLLKEKLNENFIVYEAFLTDKKHGAVRCTRQIMERIDKDRASDPVIAVLGGDGTMNEVMTTLNDRNDIAIAYLPTGSSNDLARALHISADPNEFIQRYQHGQIRNVDLGQLEIPGSVPRSKRNFCVSCGIGLDAAVCKETNSSPVKDLLNRLHLGKLSYVVIAIKQILTARQTSCDITLADRTTHHFDRVLFVVTMIHPYEGGGVKMTPMADGCDGRFDIMVVANLHPFRAFYLLPLAFLGKHTNSRFIHFLRSESLTIHTDDKLTVHADGEYAGELQTLSLTCIHGGVRFII